nr:hypothetical protein BaRGS_031286 [Batillaria attramentaria]
MKRKMLGDSTSTQVLRDLEISLRTNHIEYSSKLNMGEARDDVHVCIMCLRAIMNHQVVEEKHRFETLMDYFKNYDEFHIDFMVACMQFVNIVVHSVENMNFRVHLQHEFTQAGLDDYLEKLRHTESDRLAVQVHAYLDNMIDVAQLLEDSETKTDALEKVAELEDELSHLNEHLQEVEDEAMTKTVELEKQLSEANAELEQLREELAQQESEMNTLRKTVNEKDEESRKRQSLLDAKLMELEQIKSSAMTIKKKIQTKYRLPILNWTPLKPQQVKGTVFSELDDEKLYNVIDFNEFEEVFRLGPAGPLHASESGTPKALKKKKPEAVTLLEPNRLRNIAITRRKIEMTNEEIVRAINGLDLKRLSLDIVDILMTILPNDQEVGRQYYL